MLKTKEVQKKVEPVIEKKTEPPVDLKPLIDKLSSIMDELSALNKSLPTAFKDIATVIESSKTVPVPPKFSEEFKNINDKFFDINTLLNTFVNNQAQFTGLINKEAPISNADNLLETVVEKLEATNALLKQNTTKRRWEFDVLKDNNGIYKVIANSK